MIISQQRIRDVISAIVDHRVELERLHQQGEGGNGCTDWPGCDCRLAEQIRDGVHTENEWRYRLTLKEHSDAR